MSVKNECIADLDSSKVFRYQNKKNHQCNPHLFLSGDEKMLCLILLKPAMKIVAVQS